MSSARLPVKLLCHVQSFIAVVRLESASRQNEHWTLKLTGLRPDYNYDSTAIKLRQLSTLYCTTSSKNVSKLETTQCERDPFEFYAIGCR